MPGLTHRYPTHRVIGDYARALAGIVLSALPATRLPLASPGFLVCAACVALFAAFGVQTWMRQRARVVVDPAYIEVRPWGGRLHWTRLGAMKLGYFSTRRDRRDGWMQLVIRGERRTIRLDSRLDGFDAIAACASRWALENRVALSPGTVENLRALGVSGPGEACVVTREVPT